MLFFSVEEFVAKLNGGLQEAAQESVDPEACILDAEDGVAGYFPEDLDLTTVKGLKAVVDKIALWNLVKRMGIAEESENQLELHKTGYNSALKDLARLKKEYQPAIKTTNSPRGKRNIKKIEIW